MKTITIIGGCGRIGLPLAALLSLGGYNVQIVDTNLESVRLLKENHASFVEPGLDLLLKKANLSSIAINSDDFKISDFIIVAVPSPESGQNEADYFWGVLNQSKNIINKKTEIIIRSTLGFGTFEQIHQRIYARNQWTKLSYCPERMAVGTALHDLQTIPQIVASQHFVSEKIIHELFTVLGIKTIAASPREATLIKLFSNSWRYAEFALANQYYLISESLGINFPSLLKKMKMEYPRASHFPAAGLVGGPCLPRDHQKVLDIFPVDFLEHAKAINQMIPLFLVEQMKTKLGSLINKRIALLGKTFKANCDDSRNSRANEIVAKLHFEQAVPVIFDPIDSQLQLSEIDQFDGLIVNVPHHEFTQKKFSIPIVDCWGYLQ